MLEDLKQRIPFYLSDFYDGFVGEKTLHKTISATIFLYFACILPAIAFGVLNFHNTRKFSFLKDPLRPEVMKISNLDGKIGVMDAIMGQTMGGILFSVLAGQPLIVIMTTAPIALYIKIIVAVAEVTSHLSPLSSLTSENRKINNNWDAGKKYSRSANKSIPETKNKINPLGFGGRGGRGG